MSSDVAGESHDVHANENRSNQEKKQKRIVKTPSQVEALENFYNEHKYPTQDMKIEFAESVGLTEKQVSGWFCHRRLKDKKLPNDVEAHAHGKQDRSSGVIQDRGSGLRQDSCGSTKQGDNRRCDPKEVESRRFTTQGLLPTELQYELGAHHDSSLEEDTSSGSSSPLKESFPQAVDRLGVATSSYPTENDAKSVKSRPGPAGYLKVKGQVENAAITAVKRQLGRHYREDGPPLGIEFEPVPPGAFENPIKMPVNQSYYVGDRAALHTLDGSRTFQHSNNSKIYERYNSKIFSPEDLDDTSFKMRHTSKHFEKYSDHQYEQIPLMPKHSNPFPRRNAQMEANEDSAGETSVQGVGEHFETRTKRGSGVKRLDSISSRQQIPYGRKVDSKQTEDYSHGHNFVVPKVSHRGLIEPMSSDLTVKRGEVVEFDGGGVPRKILKEGELYEERRGIDEYSELIPVKIHSVNEMRVTKRSRDEFTHQRYPRKDTMVEVPPWTNKTKRSTAEMPSSFSEDETAETSSSGG